MLKITLEKICAIGVYSIEYRIEGWKLFWVIRCTGALSGHVLEE